MVHVLLVLWLETSTELLFCWPVCYCSVKTISLWYYLSAFVCFTWCLDYLLKRLLTKVQVRLYLMY